MKKQFETEVLGFISATEYKALLIRLNSLCGKGATAKRLSLQIMDYSRTNVDTRIRVTNGAAEIMQKIGNWESDTRQEVSINIPSTIGDVLGHWHVLSSLLQSTDRKRTVIQMESTTYIFNGEFEVKATHQFGKTDIYSYEIEALKPGVEPRSVVQSLGLPVDNTLQDSKFWEEFNQKVNIDADSLTESEFHDIVASYL